MEPTERILIRTYGLMVDADLAAGQLRAQGIECEIRTDDCAGMYPSMGVIQLLVAPGDAEDARRMLREAAPPPPMLTCPGEAKVAPPPRVLRFNFGLLVGVTVGVLIHISYSRMWELRDINSHYDYDGDGLSESVQYWKMGKLVEERWDRNRDERPDAWSYYSNGLQIASEADDNFDRKPDCSHSYSKRQLIASSMHDTDFNGVPDVTVIYTNGLVLRMDWGPNGSKIIMLRQVYRHGWLEEELRDQNGDGLFDVSILFDRFCTPIRTNNLRPTTQSP